METNINIWTSKGNEFLTHCIEKVETQDEADQLLHQYAAYIFIKDDSADSSIDKAIQIARDNIGYYAGYYKSELAARAEELFKCKHPVLGTVEERSKLTSEEILKIGLKMGRESKYKKIKL